MSTSDPLRRTALLLAGWSRRDREWALTRLPSSRRLTLRRLIDEVQALRLPGNLLLDAPESANAAAITVPAEATGELAPLAPLLRSLPTPWAIRVLQAWSATSANVAALFAADSRLADLQRQLDAAPVLPPLLARTLREASLSQASLQADASGVSRRG